MESGPQPQQPRWTTCAGVRGTICSTQFIEAHVPSSLYLAAAAFPMAFSLSEETMGSSSHMRSPQPPPPFSREPQTTVGDTVRCVLYALTSVRPRTEDGGRRRGSERSCRCCVTSPSERSVRSPRLFSLSSLPLPSSSPFLLPSSRPSLWRRRRPHPLHPHMSVISRARSQDRSALIIAVKPGPSFPSRLSTPHSPRSRGSISTAPS